jgi:hypothetical protein
MLSDMAVGQRVEVLPQWRELEERPITAVFLSRAGCGRIAATMIFATSADAATSRLRVCRQ